MRQQVPMYPCLDQRSDMAHIAQKLGDATDAEMHVVRRGHGRPLLLINGLGGTWRSWGPILDALAAEREVIAIDLPGFGDSPPLAGRSRSRRSPTRSPRSWIGRTCAVWM